MSAKSQLLHYEAVRRPASNARCMHYNIDAAWTTAGTGTSWFYPNHGVFGSQLNEDWQGRLISSQPFVADISMSWIEYPPDTDPAPPAPEYGSTELIFEWVDDAGTVISEAGSYLASGQGSPAGIFSMAIQGPLGGGAAGLKQRLVTTAGNSSGLVLTATMGVTHAVLWLWKETVA